MPRQPHLGRRTTSGASSVIPDGWTETPAAIVASTLDCTVRIGPAGGPPAWNPANRRTEAAVAAPVYVGPASVGLASTGSSSEGQRTVQAEDDVDQRTYQLRLDPRLRGVDEVKVDHVVTVTSSPGGRLDGMRLLVTGAGRPGREFSRVISARTYN